MILQKVARAARAGLPPLVGASRTPVGLLTHCRYFPTHLPAPTSPSGSKRWIHAQPVEAPSAVVDTRPILRPYQTEAIDECLRALDSGLRRIGVSSPTGSGKTTMFMSLIPRVEFQGRKQVLVLVGSVELAAQAEGAARKILGEGYTVEVEQGTRKASGKADVTIATYQTLSNAERLIKFDPNDFKLVIVDEAHHAAALSYVRLLHYFNDGVILPEETGPYSSFEHGNQVPIVGFSATFRRHDQLALSAVFEEIVFHRDVATMLQDGILCPVRATAIYADLHLDEVSLTSSGDYNTRSLATRVNTPVMNDLIVKTYLLETANRRSTLVFAVNIQHVNDLVKEFRSAGVDARSISARTDPKERRDTVASFAQGVFPVLINCEVLTEGADIPMVDCIILARPTKSKNLLTQMIGRGLRQSPDTGKKDLRVLDIADNISRASGLRVDPTLFGLGYESMQEDPREENEDISELIEDVDLEDHSATIKRVRMVDSDDPFGIWTEKKQVFARMSPYAWVACGANKYVLELIGHGFITASQEEQGPWTVWYTPKLFSPDPAERLANKRSPYLRRRHVSSADTLQRALETADQYTKRIFPGDPAKILHRRAPWRLRPASKKQADMLRKLKGVESDETHVTLFGKQVPLSEVTAGEVANFATALHHGAMALFRKQEKAAVRAVEKEKRQAEKQVQKEGRAAARAAEKERKLVEKQSAWAARNLQRPDM